MPAGDSEGFERALDQARRREQASDGAVHSGSCNFRLTASVAIERALPSGGEARFGLALSWTEEPAASPLPKGPAAVEESPAIKGTAGPGADTPAEIAEALGLGVSPTLESLSIRWREFVWRNHPDRQAPDARGRANARVAIANTLYDRARRDLTGAR